MKDQAVISELIGHFSENEEQPAIIAAAREAGILEQHLET